MKNLEQLPVVLSASDREIGLASLSLSAVLLGQLVQKGHLEPDEASVVAAAAAHGCRKQGNEASARIIEEMIPSSRQVDVGDQADEFGLAIEQEPRH